MKRLLQPFVLTLTAIILALYAYASWRLTATPLQRVLLAVPFLLVWSVPVFYWVLGRESRSTADEAWQALAYLCAGWGNFLVLILLVRDLLLLVLAYVPPMAWTPSLRAVLGPGEVFAASFAALALGVLVALRGPRVHRVKLSIEGLDPRLAGFRIVQISDLHVGPIIGAGYVRRVVEQARSLAPDLVAMTGDMVDGSVARLAPKIAPLAELARTHLSLLCLGNHDYYSGAAAWTAHFRSLGLGVLLNEHVLLEHQGARMLVGGVVDPAVRLQDPHAAPRPDLASGQGVAADFRLLLAHHPGLAPLAQKAGFDLQLSGHTHAGQFFPWTLAVRMVHAPHVMGLSREGRMWVYVNPGTGSWGPPVRFGTRTEITLLTLAAEPKK